MSEDTPKVDLGATCQLHPVCERMTDEVFGRVLNQKLKERGISIAYNSSNRTNLQQMTVANNKSMLFLPPGAKMPIAIMQLSLAQLWNWTDKPLDQTREAFPQLDFEEVVFISTGATPMHPEKRKD